MFKTVKLCQLIFESAFQGLGNIISFSERLNYIRTGNHTATLFKCVLNVLINLCISIQIQLRHGTKGRCTVAYLLIQ